MRGEEKRKGRGKGRGIRAKRIGMGRGDEGGEKRKGRGKGRGIRAQRIGEGRVGEMMEKRRGRGEERGGDKSEKDRGGGRLIEDVSNSATLYLDLNYVVLLA